MIAKMKARGFCCSFCGRSKGEVANIVTGTPQRAPGVPKQMIGKSAFICNECVERCHQMVTNAELSSNSAVITK
jgi:ATP-dependent protease Clp ATPase subunit